MRKIFAALALTLTVHVANAAPFGFDDVVARAEELSRQPYKPPAQIPKFMQDLSFTDYQNIRFDPAKSLWSESNSKFQVMFIAPGLYYTHPVAVNVIDAIGVSPVPFRKSDFTFQDPELQKRTSSADGTISDTRSASRACSGES